MRHQPLRIDQREAFFMEATSMISFIWDFLSQDVAIWDGFHSPMLSWLGSFGILLFFFWHVVRLVSGVAVVQRCYGRLWPTLHKLATGRKTVGQEWLSIQALAESQQARQTLPRPSRIDLDDVQALDAAMRREPLMEQAWFHYRKTFVIERTAWFIEPRVFSTRAAAEFFTHDVLASRVNVPFYNQLPSLITGLGLLLTFLAILIGLSKLHADGSQIVGIQGLINGLAGKFLTSIVGLICANVFVLIEKSLFHRFARTQQQFLAILDELFPRKTMEQMLENFNPAGKPTAAGVPAPVSGPADSQLATTVGERLNASLTALTTAMQTLTARGNGESHPTYERLAEDLAHAIKREMATPIHELNQAIQELTRSVAGLRGKTGEEQATAPTDRPWDERSGLLPEGEDPCDATMSGLRWFANWRAQSPA
jgi:hypothetical protein